MRHLLIALSFIALFYVPQVVLAGDLDDLKAADTIGEKLNFSLNPNDTEAYLNCLTDEFIYIDAYIATPITTTKEEIKQSRISSIAVTEYLTWMGAGSIYRVVGNSGVVCKWGTEISKTQNAPEIIRNLRYSLNYVKVSGKWLLHSAHISVMPSGN